MKPAPFEYAAPGSVGEAVAVLAADPESRILAGGQSLVPLMNLRLARPSVLLDVGGIAALEFVEVSADAVTLGARCRHRRLELDPDLAAAAPLLAEAAALVGQAQSRSRGTLGGSLAHGDPAAELGAALVALEGSVRVQGVNSERRIEAADLFEGIFTTSLRPGEMIVDVTVPAARAGHGAAFVEHAPRHGDFAVAGVGVALDRDSSGVCTRARAAGCGLGSTPADLSGALGAVVGERSLTEPLLRGVARGVDGLVDPLGDVHCSADDRRELAQGLVVAALTRAWDRAERSAR